MSEYIFTLPDLGEGTVEAEVSEWHIKVGDMVTEDQPIADMLTDKAAVEVPAPVSGKVVSLGGELGDIIAVGAPLVVIETDAGAATKDRAPAPVQRSQPAPPAPKREKSGAPPVRAETPAVSKKPPIESIGSVAQTMPDIALYASKTTGRVLTSPAIRRLAREHQINLSQVTGSGPRGRILRSDFDTYVTNLQKIPTAVAPAKRSGAKEIKVIGMRRLIARRMSASKSEIPHFSYIEEIDVTELERFRQELNQRYAAHGVKFTYLPLLVQATAKALIEFPQCNALYDKERKVIVQHAAMHAGIATQTPDGLKVPVVQHAEAMNLPTLAQEISGVALAARNGSANKAQLSGSTITITSLGKLGGIASTPVINQPEVAVLGVNRAVDRPMVVNGGIYIRRMMNISASFDHRFVDGYDAAGFIQAIKELLENPKNTFAAG